MSRQYFGTDGIRGRVGEGAITPSFVLQLGWAVGKVLGKGADRPRILIGKDTRLSGYMFESALEAGLSAAGCDVWLLGVMPTPGVAYLTRTFKARAGIVISASHNAYEDNGIKFFTPDGAKLSDEIEAEIEAMVEEPLTILDNRFLGKARRVEDADGRYIEYCKGCFSNQLTLKGLKIVLDCAHGATYSIGPKVFDELRAEVITIGHKPDGANINDGCGSTNPAMLQQAVLEHEADVGIAFDGDGDRVVMVDHEGTIVDGDQLLFAIYQLYQSLGLWHGGVVGTLMTNLGLENALEKESVPFARAKVGDRYVLETLAAQGWFLGGESSGHILCLDKSTTGDGIVSALQVLWGMVQLDRSLKDLVAPVKKCPQTMVNVRIKPGGSVCDHPQVLEAVAALESELGNEGRVLLRPSGTEPVVRVMVEGHDASKVAAHAQALAEVVKSVA